MSGPESVSKGCFGFRPRNQTGNSRPKLNFLNPLQIFSREIWYQGYLEIWTEIENKLEDVNDEVTESLLGDLIEFIISTETTHQIPTAAILTGVNLPDHGVLFDRLIKKIKGDREASHCVALLNSSDCSSLKHVVERAVFSLVSGLTECTHQTDSEDSEGNSDEDDVNIRSGRRIKKSDCTMPYLLKWHQNENKRSPNKKLRLSKPGKGKLVVILQDFEAIPQKVVQNFVNILSGYMKELPLVLVFGIATALSSLSDNLSHSTTTRLKVKAFHSQPSVYFLNNTLNKVFLSPDCPFQLSGKIFKFFTNVFLFYDFSVNRFTEGIKYCLMEHFREGRGPVGLLCCLEENLKKNIAKLSYEHLEEIRQIKSFRAYVERIKDENEINRLMKNDDFTKKRLFEIILQLRKTIKEFYLCLRILHLLVFQLPGSPLGVQIRELYTTAMTKDVCKTENYNECRHLLEFQAKDQLISKIDQVLTLLQENEPLLQTMQDRLIHYRDKLQNAGLKKIKNSPTKVEIKCRAQLKQKVMEMGITNQTEFEQTRKEVLDYMFEALGDGLQPPSIVNKWCLWEIVVIGETEARLRVVPRIRAPIHVALNNPYHYLQCTCCKLDSDDQILPTLPDICIVYKLHLESGSLINMYDWLQSFNLIVNPKGKQGVEVDQHIQARFTQAVAELEFLGFVKSSRRKADHMERLTWGGPILAS